MEADKMIEFRDLALLELKRAERYRNFLSLLVLNLSEFLSSAGRRKITSQEEANQFIHMVIDRVKREARETDMISNLDDARLVMILPETDRSGAEIACGRMKELLSEFMAEFLESNYRFDVPVEISSFPDQRTDNISFKTQLEKLFALA
ncbi:MAG: hypothetical protein R3F48_04360 [Candidatus Zixiibacteriota bacterium]